MEKLLEKLEKEYGEIYKIIFDEISKLQIEEKFLERQAESLIENIRKNESEEIIEKLQEILDRNDPDLKLQDEYQEHIEKIIEFADKHDSEDLASNLKAAEVLKEQFGSTDPSSFAFH